MIKYIEDKFEEKEGKNMLEAFVDRILEEGEKIAKKGAIEGREKGIKEGIKEGRKYNIPISVDTMEKGYPILCA